MTETENAYRILARKPFKNWLLVRPKKLDSNIRRGGGWKCATLIFAILNWQRTIYGAT